MIIEVDVETAEGSIMYAIEADSVESAEEIAAEGARELGYAVREAIALDVHRSEPADCLSDEYDEFAEAEEQRRVVQDEQQFIAVSQGYAREGYLAKTNPLGVPGSERGPCLPGRCRHLTCACAHDLASNYPCAVCGEPLGYELEYKYVDFAKYAHAVCADRKAAA
jgi:hypothetical protein